MLLINNGFLMKGKWYIKIIFVKIIGIFYIYVDLDLLDLCFVKIKNGCMV